jgi:nitroreductase
MRLGNNVAVTVYLNGRLYSREDKILQPPGSAGGRMNNSAYDQLMQLVQKRRSIRRFKSDPLDKDLINKILEVARWAPSGFSTQPWEFVVLTEKEHRQAIVRFTAPYWQACLDMEQARPEWQGKTWQLKGMTNEPGDYSEAPAYILVFGDSRALDALPMGVQCDKHRKQLIYQSSLANTFLYMQLAAASLGLAAQWYSAVQTPYSSCLIKEYLGVPEQFDVYDMMVLGYPALTPTKKFLRKFEEMVHFGINDSASFRSDEQVRDFVRRARAWVTGMHAKKSSP